MNDQTIPMTDEELIEHTLKDAIHSGYHLVKGLPLNVFTQNTAFDSNIFTANSERLMSNFKDFGNPIYPVEIYMQQMNTNPFNITRFIPQPGQVILLGIGRVSPITLAGLVKKDDPLAKTYVESMDYFVVGVANIEKNWMFGMKCVYSIHNGSSILSQKLDPMSEYNLNKTYTDMRREIQADKEKLSMEKVPVRLLIACDEMEIKAFTY